MGLGGGAFSPPPPGHFPKRETARSSSESVALRKAEAAPSLLAPPEPATLISPWLEGRGGGEGGGGMQRPRVCPLPTPDASARLERSLRSHVGTGKTTTASDRRPASREGSAQGSPSLVLARTKFRVYFGAEQHPKCSPEKSRGGGPRLPPHLPPLASLFVCASACAWRQIVLGCSWQAAGQPPSATARGKD